MVQGRRRDIGLGALRIDELGVVSPLREIPILQRPSLTLAEAREKAALLRAMAKAGRDPVAERDRDRRSDVTFAVAATEMHSDKSTGWSEKTATQFLSALKTHAFPKLGSRYVADISAEDIRLALAPIWQSKPAQAVKVRARIGQVLDYSKAKGWRETEAPRRSLSTILSAQPAAGAMEAMPYADVPKFFAEQSAKGTAVSRAALLFQILTAARSGEVRGARWSQIDFAAREWRRPKELMKGPIAKRKPHTVTLNSQAIAVLERIREFTGKTRPDDFIFPGPKGGQLSDMALSSVMRDAGLDSVPHGFRSSFRDWAAEKMSKIPDPVAEAALSHVVPEKVVAAYKRTTFLDMRRKLLAAWGAYVVSANA
jgi:integrase